MSWLSRVRNGIPFLPKRQTAENLWHKCTKCGTMVFVKEWEENYSVCPRCNFHDRIGSAHLPENFRALIVGMARGREWIWVNGNHDPDGVVDLPGASVDEVHYAGLTFRHEPRNGLQSGEIAGHLHPSATVRRRERSIRRPCFATDGARLLMPAFGVMSGGLDLGHQAMTGLFDKESLIAHLLGRDRIYSVRYGNLRG